MSLTAVRSTIFLLGSAIAAQSGNWQLLAPAARPSPRGDHAMVYDLQRARVVMFGGVAGGPGLLNDTWEWDGSNWAPVTTSTAHLPRSGHAMVYDVQRGLVVLFGGYANLGGVVDDTWEFDGALWVQVAAPIRPPAREFHTMTYDLARRRIVLFGGFGVAELGDTWEFDGASWILRAFPPGSAPTPRYGHRAVYDMARGRVVLFGGNGGGTWSDDTWEYDGNAWTQVPTASQPSPRFAHQMAYDTARGLVVVIGGWGYGPFEDTWEYDGVDWTRNLTLDHPPTRCCAATAYDLANDRIVVFGGADYPASLTDETWRYAVGTLALATAYGAGCGSPPLSLSPDPAARPWIGSTARALIANVPAAFAGVAFGSSDQLFAGQTLPLSLAPLGMPGCSLWHSAEVVGGATSMLPSGLHEFVLPIQNAPVLLGLEVFLQAYALAPGANPLQLIVSNGLAWRIGDV